MSHFEKILQLDTPDVAKKLLGQYLICNKNNLDIIGKIVEIEAYLKDDPASHSYNGINNRNISMFNKAGFTYVYLSYGIHYCINIVTKNSGEAVLIRALEPVAGIERMKVNRSKTNLKDLCSGPGKLTQALNINLNDDGIDLLKPNSQIQLKYNNRQISDNNIFTTQRVGISKAKELPLRFYIKNNIYISKK